MSELIPWRVNDLTGQKIGMWTVECFDGVSDRNQAKWICVCSCPAKTRRSVSGRHLRAGKSLCCGCLGDAVLGNARRIHGLARTPEYSAWKSARTRCINPNHPCYADYGGRGITFCKEWDDSFETFLKDMGLRPSADKTLDRLDNDKGYSKENCAWVTRVEQSRNRRSSKFIEYKGEKLTYTEWGRRLGISDNTISIRLNKLGWSIEKTLTTPLRPKRKTPTQLRAGVEDYIAACLASI